MTKCNCKSFKMVFEFKYFYYFNLKWSEHIQNNMQNKMRRLAVLFYKICFLNKFTISLLH